jgi:hypothetical protein
MAEILLTQAEADSLIAVEKHCTEKRILLFPEPGGKLSVALTSADRRENFFLDATRAQIKLSKATYQTRARQTIILMRLDIDGPPHRNPDGEEVPCPHVHMYREGYADKWAYPAPSEQYPDLGDLFSALEAFMRHCNITVPPPIERGLFS